MENAAQNNDEKTIMSMFHGMWQNRCLAVLIGLNIPEILCNSEQQSMSVNDVATQAGCRTSEQLYPILRVLAQWGIGLELPNKHFSKNNALELLRKDTGKPSLGHFMHFYCSDENWASMLGLPEAVKKGTPAFRTHHGMVHFDYMNGLATHAYDPNKMWTGSSKNPIGSNERRVEFSQNYDIAMTYDNNIESALGKDIFKVVPWSSCQRLMDIGGSTGTFLASILQQPGCEHVQGVLNDLPAIIERAKTELPHLGIEPNRIELLAHDIFKPFPEHVKVDGVLAKILMRMFSPEQTRALLTNLRPILPPNGGRFFIVENFLPEVGDFEHNTSPRGIQWGFRNIHVHSGGGKLRSKKEWVDYLGALGKDVGYRVANVYETNPGGLAVIELMTEA